MLLVATSYGGWNEHIVPFVKSVRNFEEKVEIVIVTDKPDVTEYMGAKIISPPKPFNCSKGQNIGIWHNVIAPLGWTIVSDVDVRCMGKFVKDIEALPHTSVYGHKFHMKGNYGAKHEWIDGWIYAFPPGFWTVVGGFDENFEGSGFEDADICWRALQNGYKLEYFEFPFFHKEAGIKREITPKYEGVRVDNIRYLQEKWKLVS